MLLHPSDRLDVPAAAMRTGNICGKSILLRWHHALVRVRGSFQAQSESSFASESVTMTSGQGGPRTVWEGVLGPHRGKWGRGFALNSAIASPASIYLNGLLGKACYRDAIDRWLEARRGWFKPGFRLDGWRTSCNLYPLRGAGSLISEGGLMETDLEFYSRRALEELQAAARAISEIARTRHLDLAESNSRKAEDARGRLCDGQAASEDKPHIPGLADPG